MPNLAGKHDASHAHVKTSSGKRSRVTAPAKAVVPSQVDEWFFLPFIFIFKINRNTALDRPV